MADIFLSYASEDRERIVPLARLLEGCGWSVFWDRKTPIGVTWAPPAVGAAKLHRHAAVRIHAQRFHSSKPRTDLPSRTRLVR